MTTLLQREGKAIALWTPDSYVLGDGERGANRNFNDDDDEEEEEMIGESSVSGTESLGFLLVVDSLVDS